MSKIIKVKVIARSSLNKITELPDGSWLAKVTAPPVDGKANDLLLKLLSEHFGKPKSFFKILRGETTKHKDVEVF
jgi:uncharacterized protein (TIGR00251 family)